MHKFLLFIQDMLSVFHEKAHIHFDSKFTNPKKLLEFTLQTFLLIIDVCASFKPKAQNTAHIYCRLYAGYCKKTLL